MVLGRTRCCLGVLTLRLSAGTVGGPVTISSGVRPGQGGLTVGCALVKPRIRDPLSLAHLLGGKGLPRDGRKLNGCFARFQHVLALTQLGPGVGPQLQR